MRIKFLICLVCITFSARAQHTITGKVTATDTKKPVALANVYLSNTSIGTVTNEQGEFRLDDLPAGKFDLVVSFIGYETFRYTAAAKDLPLRLNIILKPRVVELREVVLSPSDRYGWEKWGSIFLENFIGTSVFAEDTRLLNSNVLRFSFDKKSNRVTATAVDRLIIENRALGYVLKYDLDVFEFDTLKRSFYFQGYPFFEEITTSRAGLQRTWARNRQTAYYGSLMHFYRSLYDRQLLKNGFMVRRWVALTEAEKKRVKKLYNELMMRKNSDLDLIGANPFMAVDNPDSIGYFKTVLKYASENAMLLDAVLPADSLAERIDSISIAFRFRGLLQVQYPAKSYPPEYGRNYMHMMTHTGRYLGRSIPISSDIFLSEMKPITVYANGNYAGGDNLITSYYWSWWEKMANKLPYDYIPPPPPPPLPVKK
jgi:hypothetical protein